MPRNLTVVESLIIVANACDKSGLVKQANKLDQIIKKLADEWPPLIPHEKGNVPTFNPEFKSLLDRAGYKHQGPDLNPEKAKRHFEIQLDAFRNQIHYWTRTVEEHISGFKRMRGYNNVIVNIQKLNDPNLTYEEALEIQNYLLLPLMELMGERGAKLHNDLMRYISTLGEKVAASKRVMDLVNSANPDLLFEY